MFEITPRRRRSYSAVLAIGLLLSPHAAPASFRSDDATYNPLFTPEPEAKLATYTEQETTIACDKTNGVLLKGEWLVDLHTKNSDNQSGLLPDVPSLQYRFEFNQAQRGSYPLFTNAANGTPKLHNLAIDIEERLIRKAVKTCANDIAKPEPASPSSPSSPSTSNPFNIR